MTTAIIITGATIALVIAFAAALSMHFDRMALKELCKPKEQLKRRKYRDAKERAGS